MPSNTDPYYDSDEEFTSPKDGHSGRHEEHPQEEKKRTTATQRKDFDHISESASMEHEVEDHGQTPLLPPTYSDATAGEAHTSPQAKESFSGNNTDSNSDVNGRRKLPISNAVPLDAENPNRSWQRSEYFSTNRRKAVLTFVTILASLVFIVLAIKSLCHRNEPEFHFHNGPSHPGRKTCPGSTYTNNATYEFVEPSQFSLIQKVRGVSNIPLDSNNYVRTEGEIHIRPATEYLDVNVRVDIIVHASDPELMHLESLEKTDSSLVIETFNHIKGLRDYTDKPCVYIDVTIFVAPGTVLENFGIDTQSLAIIFHPGLDYTIEENTTLSTISQPIRMPNSSSKLLTTTRTREIIIHSSSGSVTGAYPLYDLLSITTLSGSVAISYFPKNSSDSNPKPASLVLGTSSGSIRVTSPVIPSSELIPNRDYKNDLSTTSGSITATLLHSSHTSLRATSAHILASIHPYGNLSSLSSPSHLSTDSKSGSTTVTVHNSLSHPLSPIRALSASHHYISGSLELSYPSQWQGQIFGNTVSGSLNIYWDGVTVIKDHKKWSGGREIEAERGEGGEATLEFGGVSGSAVLRGL